MERIENLEAARADYDEDYFAWTGAQAALLRAGRLSSADIENIAEEIESLGRSVRAGIRSRFARIIEHLIKLRFSSAQQPRRGWTESIVHAQSKIVADIEDNPSLRNHLPLLLDQAHKLGRSAASVALAKYDELDDQVAAGIAVFSIDLNDALGDLLDS